MTKGRRQTPNGLFCACEHLLHVGLVVTLLGILTSWGLTGCSITGGGIPPGPSTGVGGGGPGAGFFPVSGRVQLARAPYSTISSALVVLQKRSGETAAGPFEVSTDGTFQIPGVSGGEYLLRVVPRSAALQAVALPFAYSGGQLVQFVVALPPANSQSATAVRLTSSSLATSVNQSSQVQAQLSGVPSDLGPSWIAFGGVGQFAAVGLIARLDAVRAGSEAIVAISGDASSGVAIDVRSASSTGGAINGGSTVGAGLTTSGGIGSTGGFDSGGPPPPPGLGDIPAPFPVRRVSR